MVRRIIDRALVSRGDKATAQRIAEILGVSNDKLTAWAKGQPPKYEDLGRIVTTFGISAHWLLTGQGEPEDETARDFSEHRAAYETRYAEALTRAAEARERAAELREELACQQDRILRAATRELRAEGCSDTIILRMHAAIVDYASDRDCPGDGIRAIEPGDTGARLPQIRG
jgi:transcriptional regulator with XRE-family HTH domain